MYQKKAVIRNKAGIHCRPSSVIMFAAEPYAKAHEITITGPRGAARLTSILDLLTMGLQKGEEVTISVTGEKEEELCLKLAELFETEFDFT
ncbi:MAG: HPr family phosphocarrier protein [Lentisphaeria bacterium]|jgi:phosphotransferase system HPr (HPr) family protein|nr:HPr family phosphocarrier protein [Lentisphaeria bacterium]MBR6241837.1 HPr family phosphocarrier protein [Lentisphaeria bacterium]MDD6338111.1 HPr family phosphocarrier protein [Lentisphaeria bacterium]